LKRGINAWNRNIHFAERLPLSYRGKAFPWQTRKGLKRNKFLTGRAGQKLIRAESPVSGAQRRKCAQKNFYAFILFEAAFLCTKGRKK
jgi:hypothetical protein